MYYWNDLFVSFKCFVKCSVCVFLAVVVVVVAVLLQTPEDGAPWTQAVGVSAL